MADTDRELLKAAAKAAGIELWQGSGSAWRSSFQTGLLMADGRVIWRPHLDSGQALKLAVKLRLDLTWTRDARDRACASRPNAAMGGENAGSDANAAMRLAIVRAAAAIGGCNG